MPTRELHTAAFAVVALACVTPAQAQGPYGIGRSATPAEIAAGTSISTATATTFRRERQRQSWPRGLRSTMRGLSRRQGRGRHRRSTGRRAGHACDAKAGENRWQLLALRPDIVRLHPPRHAANAPQSLDNDDVYAVSGYILNLNGLLPADATLDARKLGAIKMPNRSMFVDDPRPDVKNPACMTGC